ncbi:MAG: hypothetical protein ABSF90_17705 [Syntrophobacteraceae bacterium]|jgi:hypothetical protein
MECYFQGCVKEGRTKEHIPPKAFFPKDQREQLITVRSCKDHNTEKSRDDLYALAHICLNSSPRNRAREVFTQCIVPQLGFNEHAFQKLMIRDSIHLGKGAVKYRVDVQRLDRFFNALSCSLIYHIARKQLPQEFSLENIYHNLIDESLTSLGIDFHAYIEQFYQNEPSDILHFGDAKLYNQGAYTVKVFGITDFRSSITIVHLFFGHFKVTSMLTRIWPENSVHMDTPPSLR